ncbi:unnamed protein product, partial [Rotaria socialis]
MIALLIDNDNDVQVINSYDQFNFLNTNNCEQNLNFSLTYLTKPNNSSKNYSIRFDLFKKDPQIYVSSRHFKIRFPFLRVYRMAVVLTVPMDSVSGSSDCPLQCHNGECIQYMNEETFVADVTVVGLKWKLDIPFDNIKPTTLVLVYLYYESIVAGLIENTTPNVISHTTSIFQRSISLYSTDSLRLIIVKLDNSYYLAVLQSFSLKRYPSCFKLKHIPKQCRNNLYCQNGAECWLDDIKCPTVTICVCTDCFFGDRCQFYAKGIGLTLDDILRYEIKPNAAFNSQTNFIKWNSAFTMLILVVGWINSVLSIVTFRNKISREVGCGIYILASSITSFCTVTIFAFKFWFLVVTLIDPLINHNWLNAFVAFERSTVVYKGALFNKIQSKRLARLVIVILPFLIAVSIIHEPLYRDLSDDQEEQPQ